MGGVRAVDEEQADAARRHVRGERREIGEGVRRSDGHVGAELHERADGSSDVIQDVDGGDDLRAVRVLRRHAAGDRQATPRVGKFGGQADDECFLEPGDLRGGARRMPRQQPCKAADVGRNGSHPP